jgi:hypothetical protein
MGTSLHDNKNVMATVILELNSLDVHQDTRRKGSDNLVLQAYLLIEIPNVTSTIQIQQVLLELRGSQRRDNHLLLKYKNQTKIKKKKLA